MSVEWVGVGLTVFGIGIPSAVGIMKLLPQREQKSHQIYVTRDFCQGQRAAVDTHMQALKESTEREFGAVKGHQDNAFADLNRRLVRVEDKIDRLLERQSGHIRKNTKED